VKYPVSLQALSSSSRAAAAAAAAFFGVTDGAEECGWLTQEATAAVYTLSAITDSPACQLVNDRLVLPSC